MRALKSHAPRWGETLPALPGLAYEVLRQARSGKLRVELAPSEIDKIRREMRRSNQRTVLGVVGTGLVLAGVVLLAVQERSVEPATVPLLTWILGGLGIYMIIAALPWDSD
jgi:ubiquinone biosynthesis protein